MLSEISQVVKDKYHMISPISGIQSMKQTSKQNITRDIEEQSNNNQGARNMYKRPKDKDKEGKDGEWEVGVGGTGESGGGKMETTVLKQQLKKNKRHVHKCQLL